MINAGIVIAPFNGLQSWDEGSNEWRNITVTVNYPKDQTPANNPITINDYLIEPAGNVWVVKGVSNIQGTPNGFTLNLQLISEEPDANVMPSLGAVNLGGIVTPVNNFIAPYWDATIVSSDVGRIAAYLTMKNASKLWSGDVPGVSLSNI